MAISTVAFLNAADSVQEVAITELDTMNATSLSLIAPHKRWMISLRQNLCQIIRRCLAIV